MHTIPYPSIRGCGHGTYLTYCCTPPKSCQLLMRHSISLRPRLLAASNSQSRPCRTASVCSPAHECNRYGHALCKRHDCRRRQAAMLVVHSMSAAGTGPVHKLHVGAVPAAEASQCRSSGKLHICMGQLVLQDRKHLLENTSCVWMRSDAAQLNWTATPAAF